MRWKRVKSDDVIDVRGASGGGGGRGRVARGGGMGFPAGGAAGGLGLVGVLIFLAIQVLGGGGGSGGFEIPSGFEQSAPVTESDPLPRDQDPDRDLRDFSEYVFVDAQNLWQKGFQGAGDRYQRSKLVLYRSGVNTGCGSASSAVGPFYCPADLRVYIDLSFFNDMQSQLGAGGDFAYAYVIAHEIGHHVQQQTGTSNEVRRQQRENPDDANALSVRLELQADCYAGVYAQTVFKQGGLEDGDLDEAFGAAEAVGDDRLQRRAGGDVRPDSFTHGTSEQRKHWFQRGYEGGDPSACDTFSGDEV